MQSQRPRGQARLIVWLFAFVLLLQPLSVVVESRATQEPMAHGSKWNDPSARATQITPRQVRGTPDGSILPAWNRFQQAALGNLSVFWQPRSGTPKAIYGLMADVSAKLTDPVEAALSFLAEEADLFKIDATADLQLIKRSESLAGHHLFFQQTYQGLPVHGSMVGVHIDWSGRIHALVSSYAPDVFLATLQPSIDAEEVYRSMLAELGTDAERVSLFADVRRELVVSVSDEGSAHLAWRVTIPAREPMGTWQALWDAHTGQRLSPLVDRNYYVNGTGQAFVPNAVVATGNDNLSDQNDSPGAVPNSAYTTVTLFDLDGSGFLNGPFVNTGDTPNRVNRASNNFTNLDRGDNGFNEVEAYWAIDDAQRYIQGLGILNAGNYSIDVNAAGTAADNSFYSGFGNGRGSIELGLGGVDDAEDGEIIWHEYGHALLDNQVPNINQNFDGMGEGFGDYWAATVSSRHPSADHAKYDPAVGEWDATFYNPGNPPFLRRVDTNAHYPEDRSSDPHVTGMIWSRALWDIHNAIGRDVTNEIILEGNFLMPSSPTLPEAAEAVLQADHNINGGANNAAMTQIFEDRGLVTPTNPTITVVTPNGGESWDIGSAHTIQWTSQDVMGNVTIRVSRDGGNMFEPLLTNTPNDGSQSWTVTGPATTQALVKIFSVNDPSVEDTSDNNFSISAPPQPTITVTAPNGGQNWEIGSTHNIQWTSTGNIANVKIALSGDNGASFTTIFASTANDGSQSWQVTGPASTTAVVKVSDVADASVSDTSNSSFTISQAAPPPTPPTCPAGKVVEGTPGAVSTLQLLYTFRDGVLAKSFRGRQLRDQFYQFSNEVVGILTLNPSLLLSTREKLQWFKPVLQSVVLGGGAVVSQNDIKAIDGLIASFATKASPALGKVLDQLRRDLRDPKVQAEFGITIIY